MYEVRPALYHKGDQSSLESSMATAHDRKRMKVELRTNGVTVTLDFSSKDEAVQFFTDAAIECQQCIKFVSTQQRVE